jgi:CheY-like chemotaxis protein
MTILDAPSEPGDFDSLAHTRNTLSGKRIALVGFAPAVVMDLTRVIGDAEAFSRPLSPLQVDPSSDVLKPFELILVDVESAAGTAWLEREKLAPVISRSIAVGRHSSLFEIASDSSLGFAEYCPLSGPDEEFLLRCILALRARPQSGQSAAAVPEGSTVVLADDDTSVTSIVRRALERNGLTCQIAANGRDALALITKVKPCAAVLDVHMPAIDGFEVLSRIKSAPEVAQTRVILLTGSEQEADIIRGFTLGAADYVCKPFNPMELTIRLMRVIGRL